MFCSGIVRLPLDEDEVGNGGGPQSTRRAPQNQLQYQAKHELFRS